MSTKWDAFLERCRDLHDLGNALRLLSWDQHVLMPRGGASSRARTIATIQRLAHERLTDPALGGLLSDLSQDTSLEDVQRRSVDLLARDHERAMRVPAGLVTELAELSGRAFEAWARARAGSDFSILQPLLERTFELKKQEADAIGWEGERYDALLDMYEPEMLTREVEDIFRDLVSELAPLAQTIIDRAGPPPPTLEGEYDIETQAEFCRWLVEQVGFDMDEGRLDVSPHPFTTTAGAGDVRQTVRYALNDPLDAIRAALHETGHALYDQGIPKGLIGLPAGETRSLGLHESQSRMWEIQVGTSRAFSGFMLENLKPRFPSQLGDVSADDFYAAINHPQRSLIRVTSNEVTYNLHVALRVELELALFRDELTVGDLPDAWDAGMEKHLGIRPDTQASGVLQDMHWSVGHIGYFATYTLGTLTAAAFFARATDELGDLSDEFARGDTSRLLEWARANVYSKAGTKPARAIVQDILGEPLTVTPFLQHLRAKYGDLFGPL